MDITSKELFDLLENNNKLLNQLHEIENYLNPNNESINEKFDINFFGDGVRKNVEAVEKLALHTLHYIHEICLNKFNKYKGKYNGNLKETELDQVILGKIYENTLRSSTPKNPFVHIDTTNDNLNIKVLDGHKITNEVSCYPWVLINQLINISNKIIVVGGRKEINKVDTDIVMLKCIDVNNVTRYFDLVENPALSYTISAGINC